MNKNKKNIYKTHRVPGGYFITLSSEYSKYAAFYLGFF